MDYQHYYLPYINQNLYRLQRSKYSKYVYSFCFDAQIGYYIRSTVIKFKLHKELKLNTVCRPPDNHEFGEIYLSTSIPLQQTLSEKFRTKWFKVKLKKKKIKQTKIGTSCI